MSKQQEVENEPKSIVFIDLEETVIDDWHNKVLLLNKIERASMFMNGRDVMFKGANVINPATPLVNMRLGLMSWAVWNAGDKAVFNQEIRPELERLLGRTFDEDLVWSMDDWADALMMHCKKRVSKDDLFDLLGKPEVLFMLMRFHPEFQGNRVFLIDDAYEHLLNMRSHANDCYVEIRNINKMEI